MSFSNTLLEELSLVLGMTKGREKFQNAGDQMWDSLDKQGVTIHLNAKVDLPAPETWTARPVFNLRDGTMVSPISL